MTFVNVCQRGECMCRKGIWSARSLLRIIVHNASAHEAKDLLHTRILEDKG